MSRALANSLMLLASFIWGVTFVVQQLAMAHVGALTYTAFRFFLGALLVAPLALREWRQARKQEIYFTARDFSAWCGLGALVFLGAALQQIGIIHTTVSNAGFLTALYVPLVPFFAWVITRERPRQLVWWSVAGSLLGTYWLNGGQLNTLTNGDTWVLCSTIFWALHVLFVGRVASQTSTPLLLACTQFMVCALLSFVLAVLTEPITLMGLQLALPTILFGGALSVGIAYTLQVVAQRYTTASEAALILSAEVLFAALAGAVFLGERLTPMALAGGVLIFISVLVVQVLPQRQPRHLDTV